MSKTFLPLLLIFSFSKAADSQAIRDSSLDGSLANVVGVYFSTLGDQSPLYNGREYIDYSFTLREGHPFFESKEFVKGEIHFEGMIYRDVPLLYDLVKDLVITRDIRNVYSVFLQSDKVRQFVISGHTFVRIENNDDNQLETGFYDQLHMGKIGLYVKREKKLIEQSDSYRVDNLVRGVNSYYIRKEGIYHSFKNKRGLLDILKSCKKDLQQYLKKNKIRFKDNPEKAMIMAVEYCNR